MQDQDSPNHSNFSPGRREACLRRSGHVERYVASVAITIEFSGYSAVVGSITERVREIRVAGKPAAARAHVRAASIGGSVYAVKTSVVRDMA